MPCTAHCQHRTKLKSSGKPSIRPGGSGEFSPTARTLRAGGLATVCTEARCPNKAECWGAKTATFLLLGRECTRGCRFCSVTATSSPMPLEDGEPARVVEAAQKMDLRYVVLTSVTRDDLPDGGAAVFAGTVRLIKAAIPDVKVEVLTPDYRGHALETLLAAEPDVFAHNVETIERLTTVYRHGRFSYRASLATLREARLLKPGIPTKSSLLLGLGETRPEIERTLLDMREADIQFLALGQYLQAKRGKAAVERYLSDDEFAELREYALSLGFTFVASGKLVRTSYKAHEGLSQVNK